MKIFSIAEFTRLLDSPAHPTISTRFLPLPDNSGFTEFRQFLFYSLDDSNVVYYIRTGPPPSHVSTSVGRPRRPAGIFPCVFRFQMMVIILKVLTQPSVCYSNIIQILFLLPGVTVYIYK